MSPILRLSFTVFLATVAVRPDTAHAIPELVDVKTSNFVTTVDALAIERLPVRCDVDYRLLSLTVTPLNPSTMDTTAIEPLLDDGSTPAGDGVYGAANGARVTLVNSITQRDVASVQVLCGRLSPGYGSSTVAATINVAPMQSERVIARCPAGQVALSGGYTAVNLKLWSHYYHFNVAPYYQDQLPDGNYEAPIGWETRVYNPGPFAQPLRSFAHCYQIPEATAAVGSVQLSPNERRFVGSAVSDQFKILGGATTGGLDAIYRGGARWDVGGGANFTRIDYQFAFGGGAPAPQTDSGMIRRAGELAWDGGGLVGGFMQDARPAGSAAAAVPVKAAVVVVPNDGTPRPTSIVQVVEFFNAARNHYFITAIAQEIADLDNGVHAGWVRTGQTFKAYAAGSGGPAGRLPFCRFYGLPAAGLDSHFYTGSVQECLDVIARFLAAWQLESGEVFQVSLPNAQTGACTAGTIPVYRTWNQRTDSNHRYMTDLALRAQMLAAGHAAEGYGPNGVAFCALL